MLSPQVKGLIKAQSKPVSNVHKIGQKILKYRKQRVYPRLILLKRKTWPFNIFRNIEKVIIKYILVISNTHVIIKNYRNDFSSQSGDFPNKYGTSLSFCLEKNVVIFTSYANKIENHLNHSNEKSPIKIILKKNNIYLF